MGFGGDRMSKQARAREKIKEEKVNSKHRDREIETQ